MKYSKNAIAISIPEAASRIGVGLSMIKSLIWSGSIPTFYVGRRRLVPVVELEAFMARQLAGAIEPNVEVTDTGANGRHRDLGTPCEATNCGAVTSARGRLESGAESRARKI